MPRQSDLTQQIADAICERLSDRESLRSICSSDDMPNKATVIRWLAANVAFRDQYARARELQADAIFDEIIDIADDARNDWKERRNKEEDRNSGYELNGEHIQRMKLRVDARKWMAGKLRPKVYGDKLEMESNITHDVTDTFAAVMKEINGSSRAK